MKVIAKALSTLLACGLVLRGFGEDALYKSTFYITLHVIYAEKINLSLQKHAFTNQKKCTIQHKINTKD